jgi:hypothetical protein
LQRIQRNVRVHANHLRQQFLRQNTQDINLRELAASYERYIDSFPTPSWP